MAKPTTPKLQNAKALQRKGRDELLFDLRNLVNNPEGSDLVFKCNDGVVVHANRWILAFRCAVFKSMLGNGMLESTQAEIPLGTLSSPVLLSVVEFLYTGSIEAYPLTNWTMGFEVIGAAKYFMIPTLEIIAQDFLLRKASSADLLHVSDAKDMLSIGLEFEESWEGKDGMLRGLVHHIGSDWLEEYNCSLSRKAVEYILSNSQRCDGHREERVSVEEYWAFRNVVLWHVFQAGPADAVSARAAVRGVLPGRKSSSLWGNMVEIPDIDTDIMSCISDKSMSENLYDSTAVLNSLVGTTICRESLEEMLQLIDLSRIPASLLLKVLYPLGIIPVPEILKALLRGALLRCVEYEPSESDWRYGPSCSPGKNGRLHCAVGDHAEEGRSSGVAVAAYLPMPFNDVYEWSFEILADDASSIEMGIVCQPPGQHFKDNLLKKSLHDFPSSRALKICRTSHNTAISERSSDDWNYHDTELEVGSEIHFRFDKPQKTCRVLFNNCNVVWENLPDGSCYPAVGFNCCEYADVQLRLCSGFSYH